MTDPTLPIWLEYAKALGPSFVAVVAASIAGTIAYRQWRTAQNKLKLDLFEKRMAIYEAAVAMIKEDWWLEDQSEWAGIAVLRAKFSPARWLLNKHVHLELEQLSKRMMERMARRRSASTPPGEHPGDQRLDELFKPFLLLGH
jgi:hypothetical protein